MKMTQRQKSKWFNDLLALRSALDNLILATPTGDVRDVLTDVNINLMQIHYKAATQFIESEQPK